MANEEFHKLYSEEFEEAQMMAHGAILGVCFGKGEQPPRLTEVLKQAYDAAFAEAFNAGVAVGRKATV